MQKQAMDVCLIFTISILLVIVKDISSKYVLVSLENSKTYLRQRSSCYENPTVELNNLTGWLNFQHTGNNKFITPPTVWQEAAIDYDSGTIGKTCECKDHECRNSELCACKQCDEAGCPGGKCSPALLMICDMKGNGIEWNELKSGMIVKIRSLHRTWPGYEYLYASVGGWIYYDWLRNRKDHYETDNLKQEWTIEKTDSIIRFQSNYRTGEYLTGDLVYDGVNCLYSSLHHDFHWLYVGSENPTSWKVTPAN